MKLNLTPSEIKILNDTMEIIKKEALPEYYEYIRYLKEKISKNLQCNREEINRFYQSLKRTIGLKYPKEDTFFCGALSDKIKNVYEQANCPIAFCSNDKPPMIFAQCSKCPEIQKFKPDFYEEITEIKSRESMDWFSGYSLIDVLFSAAKENVDIEDTRCFGEIIPARHPDNYHYIIYVRKLKAKKNLKGELLKNELKQLDRMLFTHWERADFENRYEDQYVLEPENFEEIKREKRKDVEYELF